MEDSRGFWKENIAWGQRGEKEKKAQCFSVSQKGTVISSTMWLAPERGERRKRLSVTPQRWRNEKGAKKYTRTEETLLLQGTWVYSDIFLMSKHFDFQWVCRPPFCLPPSLQQPLLHTHSMPGEISHYGWSQQIKGSSGLCQRSTPGTTKHSCISMLQRPKKIPFPKQSPES